MRHPNFTSQRVVALLCPQGKRQHIIWDGRTPGPGLRVTAAGAKTFIYQARLHGHTVRVTIGDVRAWSVAQAQEEAIRLRCLTDRGIDPRTERAEQLARSEAEREDAKRREMLVGEAWAAYMAHPAHQWSPRHRLDHERLAIAGQGLPLDAVVADFVTGAAEVLSPDNVAGHWDMVEGQGAIFHPGYLQVTVGLLVGSQPDAFVERFAAPVRTRASSSTPTRAGRLRNSRRSHRPSPNSTC